MIILQPPNVWFVQLVLLTLTLPACYQTMDVQCHYSTDCESTDYCRAGQCVPAAQPSSGLKNERLQDPELYDTSDTQTVLDSEVPTPTPCPNGYLPEPGDIVINEFLVNVPPGLAGDANGDGVRHPHDDEFVELVNISDHQLDLTGLKIQNATSTKYTSPRFCLDAGHTLVVFGGIQYGATLPSGPDFHSTIAHSRFMFNNDQGTIVVRSASNQELLRIDYGRSPPQALTLSPQLYGTSFVPHSSLVPDAFFSPGTCSDSQPISTRCPLEVPDTDDLDSEE